MKEITRRAALVALAGGAAGALLAPAVAATPAQPKPRKGFFDSPEYAALAPDASDREVRAAMERYLEGKGVRSLETAPAAIAPLTEEQVKDFLRGFDNEENLPLHLAGIQFRSTEKLEKEWDAGIFAPPCPPVKVEPKPIDTTGNPFAEPGEFTVEASDVERDLLLFLQNAAAPVFFWDTERGRADAIAEGIPAHEIERERRQWEEAHRAQARKLRAYLERFA